MLLLKNIEYGIIRGSIYDFEFAGDELPLHIHTEKDNHITIVAKGKFKVYSHDWEIEATEGQLLDFEPDQPHAFKALEDNSRLFNLVRAENDVLL